MNPFTWLFIALLSMDAVRELMGMSSVLGCGELRGPFQATQARVTSGACANRRR